MAIHSFLKAEKGDPDWQFSPEDYFGKEFKIIDANMVELDEGVTEKVVLRQNPTEKDLLAKHLKIQANKGAVLDMIILNDVDENLQQVFLYDIYLKPGSNFNLGLFTKNGKFNKHIIQVFQEEGSTFSTYGIIHNESGGDTEVITKIVQQGLDCDNIQFFLGQAGDESQTVFQSIVVAEKDAEGSDISIENFNLVTGENGRCFSKPETYVNAEFVCSEHTSQTKPISLEKISYLESRGISRNTAREMIISGFRSQIIDIVVDSSIKEEIKKMYSE